MTAGLGLPIAFPGEMGYNEADFLKGEDFMSKKNTVISILALALAAVALVISLMTLLRPGEDGVDVTAQLQALEEKNAQLQSRVDALAAQVSAGTGAAAGGLSGWELIPVPWEDGSGASVTMNATPTGDAEGMTASLYVRKGSAEIVTQPCEWTGTAFTATVELTAQDGYSYYCILESGGGREQIALSTPENPTADIPVYLATALSAYCNLTLDSWLDQDGTLTVTTAYVQAQLPQLTAMGGVPTIQRAELVLRYQGEAFSAAEVVPEAGTGVGAYELTVTDVKLDMPRMEEDESLELWLELTLSDGQVLSALGASWYQAGDELFVVVG